MASTYTTDLRLEIQTDGENSETWGDRTNTNLNLLEDAISGAVEISTTGGTTTLTANNAATDQARMAVLKITGVLVSNATIVIPGNTKRYLVWNATSGAYTVTVKVSGQTGADVVQGYRSELYCDGTTTYHSTTGMPAPHLGTPTSLVLTNATGLPLTTAAIPALTTANIAFLQASQIPLLVADGGTGVTSTASVAALNVSLHGGLTTAQIAVLGTAQVQALNVSHLGSLTTSQIAVLASSNTFGAGTTQNFAAIAVTSTAQVANLNAALAGNLTGTPTIPAITLGGAVTGNGQNISGLGTIGSGAITSTGSVDTTYAGLTVVNNSNGVSATGAVRYQNNVGTTLAYTGLAGGSRNTYGVMTANSLTTYTDNAAGMAWLIDAAGSFRFGTTTTTVATITSTGINSTNIGVTTPGTVAATTLSATGSISKTSSANTSVDGLVLTNSTSGTAAAIDVTLTAGTASSYIYQISQGYTTSGNYVASGTLWDVPLQFGVSVAGTRVTTVSSTGLAVTGALSATGGLQSTPVGSVTPSTGAFTTLSASGTSTLTGNVGVGIAPSGSAYSPLLVYTTQAGGGIEIQNPLPATLRLISNSVNAGARNWRISTNTLAYGDFGIYRSTTQGGAPDTVTLGIDTNGAVTIANGLAVTGALSATTTISAGTTIGVGATAAAAVGIMDVAPLTGAVSGSGIHSRPVFDGSFTASTSGIYIAPTFSSNQTAANFKGIWIDNVGKGSATITTNYGLLIENQTSGATNYAIYTGTGKVQFGDVVQAASTISVGAAAPSASGAGVSFPATQSASTDANTLDDYREASYTGTLTGCTTAPTTTIYFTKSGNEVTVDVISTLFATSNATTMTITGGPAAMRPANTKRSAFHVIDNGNDVFGSVAIDSAGTLTFSNGIVEGALFTNSGNKGIKAFSFSYTLI